MRVLELASLFVVATAFLAAGCSSRATSEEEVRTEQRVTEFSQWDQNDDGSLTSEELRLWIEEEGLLRRYDRDEDGELSDQELGDLLFDVMDADGDGRIDPAEFDRVDLR